MRPLSTRINNIGGAGGRSLIKRPDDFIYMGTGTIDFETFEHIHEAGIRAITEDFTAYTDNQGMPSLRRAIADKLARENNLSYEASEILVTPGSSEALSAIPNVVLEPGDEAIMFDPHYIGAFAAIVELALGKPVILPTSAENNWQPDPQQVEDAITPRTRLLFMVSPSNPVGTVLTEETVRALADIAIRHDLYVVSDELYEKLTFDAKKVFSPAQLPGMRERTFTVNGFSKSYGMTGWRIGYVACPQPLLQAVHRAQIYVGICAPSMSQCAALAALTGPQEQHARMVEELDRRRHFVVEALNEIGGVNAQPQDATFYTFVDIRDYMEKKGDAVRDVLGRIEGYEPPTSISAQFSDFLLAHGNVFLSSGSAFGQAGEGYVRISEADRMEKLERGVSAITTALNSV